MEKEKAVFDKMRFQVENNVRDGATGRSVVHLEMSLS